jgi:hypothetical protein
MKLARNPRALNGRSGLDDCKMYGAQTLALLTRSEVHTHMYMTASSSRARSSSLWSQIKAIRTHRPLYSSSIRPSQQDSLFYT